MPPPPLSPPTLDPQDEDLTPLHRIPRVMKNCGDECGKISVLQLIMQTPEVWPAHLSECADRVSLDKSCVRCCLHWLSETGKPDAVVAGRQVVVSCFVDALKAAATSTDSVSEWKVLPEPQT